MKSVALTVVVLLVCGGIAAHAYNSLQGNWKGLWTIDSATSNRLFIKMYGSVGSYTGAIDNLDTAVDDTPLSGVSGTYPTVKLTFSGGDYFQGTGDAAYTQLTGNWVHSSHSYPITFVRNPNVYDFLPFTYNDGVGDTMPYRLFVPTNYAATQSYPLVLFLHGAGERGSDNTTQLTGETGELAFVFNENQAAVPSFMLAPQCPAYIPETTGWTDTTIHALVLGILAAVESQYHIDTNRVYVTGLSMGGFGTWDMLTRNPSLFAAGIPICGETVTANPAAFYQIPLWDFHAADDSVVPITNSDIVIGQMRVLGGTPVYTRYASGGHNVWPSAYATQLLYRWVMAQKRGGFSNLPPFVQISSPSSQPYYSTPNNNVSLAGSAGDLTAAITEIDWTNTLGGSGTASGTTTWSVPSVTLGTGTNVVSLQATGTSWIPVYGGNTTFGAIIRMQQVAAPIVISSITRSNNSAVLSWTGGSSPYYIDRMTNFSSRLWQPVSTGSTHSVSVPVNLPRAFFRVRN